MSLTDEIYAELMDGLEKGLDWQQILAKHKASKGPLYNALGRVIREVEAKIRALSEKKAKVQEELDENGLTLDQLARQIKEAESSLAPLENRRNILNEEIETLGGNLAEKSKLLGHAGKLEKLGFDIERLRQLREALTEIGAKNGLKGKEAVSKFFAELKDYDAKTGFEGEIQRLKTITETKKLEAEKWQAEEEALKRKHDDLKEAIGAVYTLRAKGVKVSQIPVWQRILNRLETVEQFDEYLAQYGTMTKLFNARKEEAESCELRLIKAQGQLQTLEKEKAKIEGAIDSLKEAGVKQLKAMTEAAEKQLKVVVAREIGETQAVGQEVRSQFSKYFTQIDQLAEKAFQMGQKLERLKQELQKYEALKETLESHAVASEEAVK